MHEEADNSPSGPAEGGGHGAHPAACENCATPLQGEFCHHCGQSAHNPLRNLGHALEEVFESFWHVDGRIFRTLRLLFIPGRVTVEYLAGHRVRFIPPLRLFVILSLLTFFVGRLVLAFEPQVNVGGEAVSFRGDDTVAEVEQRRGRLLEELAEKEREAAETPGPDAARVAARARIESQAAARIAELRKGKVPAPNAAAEAELAAEALAVTDAPAEGDGDADGSGPGDAAGAKQPAAAGTATPAEPSAGPPAEPARERSVAGDDGDDEDDDDSCEDLRRRADDRPWLPAFADRWINTRVVRACENFRHVDTEGSRLFEAGMAAVPSALFVLMPVFALLLKLVYLGSGRSYLEHLVAALYSHAFLLLMLLVLFLLSASENIGVPGWLRGLGYAAVWIWIPLYLWKMQRRVYGGGWLSNLVRYTIIGCTYFVLVSLATAYAVLMGISA